MVFCSKQITIMNESFFSSIAHSCLTFCDPMDCCTLGFPVHHHLPELAQTQCSLSRSCHPIISSYVVPFSSCLQSSPISGSFARSQFFTSSGQSTGASASPSVLPMNIEHWFPWTYWLDLLVVQGTFKSFLLTTVQEHQFFSAQLSYSPTLTCIHDYWKNHSFDWTDLCWQSNVSAF